MNRKFAIFAIMGLFLVSLSQVCLCKDLRVLARTFDGNNKKLEAYITINDDLTIFDLGQKVCETLLGRRYDSVTVAGHLWHWHENHHFIRNTNVARDRVVRVVCQDKKKPVEVVEK